MRAVLFDFNGTLFDDTRFHIVAWKRYMRRRFGIELTETQIRERFIGPNNSAILQNVFGDCLTPEERCAISLEKEAEYRSVVREKRENLCLIDGAAELFDLLVARKIPFALATASVRPNVDFYLHELGLAKWFTIDRIVYDEGKLASKPDPAFYVEAARRIGASPEDCLICEDSRTGIEAAARFGASRIVAIDRTTPRNALDTDPRIYAVIHDFRNFERFL